MAVYTPIFEQIFGDIRIGGHKANRNYWNGKIDDLYIYKGIPSPKETQQVKDGKPLEL